MRLYRFSYPLTKPYPFRWFTPLVIVGGLILAVLFSFITFPANAYDMRQVPSFDPNRTVREETPSWPWLDDNLRPKCEPYDLSVGSRFFTTNKGFSYTVDKVHLHNSTSETNVVDQSVPYLNNPLEDCRPTYIIIDFMKGDTAKPPTWWVSWIGNSYFEAKATTRDGTAMIDFSMKKSSVAKDVWDYIIAPDSNASFWWGAQLLNTYWFSFMEVLSKKGNFVTEKYGFFNRGRFTFHFNQTRDRGIHDVDFFDLGFYVVSSSTAYILNPSQWENDTQFSMDEIYNNSQHNVSLAITEASYFAKILHSFLIADLANPRIPNLLLEGADLRDFLSGKGNDTNRQPGGVLSELRDENFAIVHSIQSPPGHSYHGLVNLNQSWDAFRDYRGELGTKNATIYKKYFCSVPHEKSWGRITLLVLVADLVFLQAAWKLLNLVAGVLVEREAPRTAMVCAGCLGTQEEEMQDLIPEDEDRQHRQ